MFFKRSVASAAISLFALTAVLSANTIPINSTGGPGWTLVAPSGSSVITTVTAPAAAGFGWVAAPAGSSWIRPDNPIPVAPPASPIDPAGNYVYKTSFNLSFTPQSGGITGFWAADNSGTAIKVNNVSIGSSVGGDGSVLSAFTINASQLQAGANTIEFLVNNTGLYPNYNPTGLLVSITSASVPEPLEAISLVGMVAGLLVVGRRRLMA